MLQIDLTCVVSDAELFPRIKENCGQYLKRVRTVEPHEGAAVLVAGGPSLRDRIGAIEKRRDHGQTIFAMNGACQLLNDHGIVPEYQILLDPQEFITHYIGEACAYLAASQCHPNVLEKVNDRAEPILWHVGIEGAEENIPRHEKGDCLVGGGFTVGLCSMCLVYAMGYRKLHLYGYDSSSTEQGDHAYKCPVAGTDRWFDSPQNVTATIGGKKFKTTLGLARQAQEFPKLCDQLIDLGCLITCDFDGLLGAVMAENRLAHAGLAA